MNPSYLLRALRVTASISANNKSQIADKTQMILSHSRRSLHSTPTFMLQPTQVGTGPGLARNLQIQATNNGIPGQARNDKTVEKFGLKQMRLQVMPE